MGMLDQLQHHQKGAVSPPTCIQELGGSMLLSTKQDAAFPYKCIEIRPLKTIAIENFCGKNSPEYG